MLGVILLAIPLAVAVAVAVIPGRLAFWRRLLPPIGGALHFGALLAMIAGKAVPPPWLDADAFGKIFLLAASAAFVLAALFLQAEAKLTTYWRDDSREKTGLAAMTASLPAATMLSLTDNAGLIAAGFGVLILCVVILSRRDDTPYSASALLAIVPAVCLLSPARFVSAWDGWRTAAAFIFAGIVCCALVFLALQGRRTLKRFLFAASFHHFGLIGFFLAQDGNGVWAGLYHALGAATVLSGLFFAAAVIADAYRSDSPPAITGVARALPATGTLWLAGVLALAGLPPFAFFLSEFAALARAFAAGDVFAAAFPLAANLVFFVVVLRPSLAMTRGGRPESVAADVLESRPLLAPALLCVALAAALGMGVPSFLVKPLDRAVEVVAATSMGERP